jgi:N-methylhydantoinase A
MSALGLLVSPLAFEVARSRRIHVDDLDAAKFSETFRALEADAISYLRQANVADKDIRITRRLDMRYQGQGHEIEVELPPAADAATLFAQLGELYGHAYEENYTLRLDEPVEIVNWKVEATAPQPDFGSRFELSGKASAEKALKGTRKAYDSRKGALTDWPVYDRYSLKPGATIAGPALIEEHESTCVVGSGDRVTVDDRLNLIADLASGE